MFICVCFWIVVLVVLIICVVYVVIWFVAMSFGLLADYGFGFVVGFSLVIVLFALGFSLLFYFDCCLLLACYD